MKMKICCSLCETQPATMLCVQDEAAMCEACDSRLHTTNKIVSKHNRVLIQNTKATETCDICQEGKGLIFCREDRAILCRRCDFSIHTTNRLAEKHKRYLLPGVTIALHGLPDPRSDKGEGSSSDTTPALVPCISGGGFGAGGKEIGNEELQSSSETRKHPRSKAGSVATSSREPEKKHGKNTTMVENYKAKLAGLDYSMLRVDELLDIPQLADGYNAHDIDALADFGDMDFDLSTLLEVPGGGGDVEVPGGRGGSGYYSAGYSSDDGNIGVVPDVDHSHKRRRMDNVYSRNGSAVP